MNDSPKFPQARMYLEAAKWGFQSLLEQQLSGYAYRFYLIGILASLRAVQHALDAHDRHLSENHERVISKWWNKTQNWKSIPELAFIKTSRDLILKRGAFDSYATRHEHGNAGEVPTVEYDLGYYVEDQRRDLGADIRSAILWCEIELESIEVEI